MSTTVRIPTTSGSPPAEIEYSDSADIKPSLSVIDAYNAPFPLLNFVQNKASSSNQLSFFGGS